MWSALVLPSHTLWKTNLWSRSTPASCCRSGAAVARVLQAGFCFFQETFPVFRHMVFNQEGLYLYIYTPYLVTLSSIPAFRLNHWNKAFALLADYCTTKCSLRCEVGTTSAQQRKTCTQWMETRDESSHGAQSSTQAVHTNSMSRQTCPFIPSGISLPAMKLCLL